MVEKIEKPTEIQLLRMMLWFEETSGHLDPPAAEFNAAYDTIKSVYGHEMVSADNVEIWRSAFAKYRAIYNAAFYGQPVLIMDWTDDNKRRLRKAVVSKQAWQLELVDLPIYKEQRSAMETDFDPALSFKALEYLVNNYPNDLAEQMQVVLE